MLGYHNVYSGGRNTACAAGEQCRRKGVPLPRSNNGGGPIICPACGLPVHGPSCGVANPNPTGRNDPIVCLRCAAVAARSSAPAAAAAAAPPLDNDDDCDYEGSGNDDNDDDDVPKKDNRKQSLKRKAIGRQVKKQLKDLYAHFRLLEPIQHYVGKAGVVQRHLACVCIHCEDAGQAVTMPRYRKNCERHIQTCKNYSGPPVVASPSAAVKDETAAKNPKKRGRPSSAAASSSSKKVAKTAAAAASATTARRGPRVQQHSGIAPFSEKEVKKAESLLLEMIVDNGLAFSLVNSFSFSRFCDALRPGSSKQLPNHDKLQTAVLNDAATEVNQSQNGLITRGAEAGHRAGLVIDAWMDIRQMHIEGVVLTLGPASFLIKSHPAKAYKGPALALARSWEDLLFKTFSYKFCYFTSDDSGQHGRARRILSLRYPFILWLRCWANQINLMVKRLLECAKFKDVAKSAIAASDTFATLGPQWREKLMDECDSMYGKKVPSNIATTRSSCWASMQACFASVLRIRSGCKHFVMRYDVDLPAELMVWSDNDFWNNLEAAEFLIRPLCDAANLMQRDKNTIAHVMLALLNLAKHILDNRNSAADAESLLKDIESRWRGEENHLFFLAFALHPLYHATAVALLKVSLEVYGNWETDKNLLTIFRLKKAARCYYQQFELNKGQGNRATDLGRLEKHIGKWLRGNSLEVDAYQPGENETEYWIAQSEEFPEISALAAALLDARPQASNCDSVFKKVVCRQQTISQHRLGTEQTFRLASLKSHLRNKYPSDRIHRDKASMIKIMLSHEHPRSDLDDDDAAAEGSQKEDQLEDVIDAGGEDYDSEQDVVQHWLDVLDAVSTETGIHEEDSNVNGDDRNPDDSKENDQYFFETRNEFLEELPTDSDDIANNYPEQNAAYFAEQKRLHGSCYVRADKYSLTRLCELLQQTTGVNLPTITSAYEKEL